MIFGGLLGSIIGAGASYAGQRTANRTNLTIAREGTAANKEEAALNRTFQKEMSSTAHQRQVADLESAGLNPLLSATGGATAPSGGQGSALGARVENEMSGSITSAIEAASLQLAKSKQKDEFKGTSKTRSLLDAQTRETKMKTKMLQKGFPAMDLQNRLYKKIQPFLRKIESGFSSNSKFYDQKNSIPMPRR